MPGPRIALVVNPALRGGARAVAAVRSCCADAGLGDPLVLPTTVEEPGPAQVRYAVSHRVERVVVAGGDGTVRLAAGVLAAAPLPDDDAGRVVLGVVPVGTANLFARSAGLPLRNLERSARLAVSADTRPTDLGVATLTRRVAHTKDTSEHPFLVVAGFGHDAATLTAVRRADKDRLRWLAYLTPGFQGLGRPGHELELTLDGRPVPDVGPVWSLLAVNAARLPAGASVVHGALLDDGLLHVVLVAPSGLRDWARVAATGLGRFTAVAGDGYPKDHPALRYRSAADALVRSPDPVLAQVDGDVVPDVVGARITVRPGVLDVAR